MFTTARLAGLALILATQTASAKNDYGGYDIVGGSAEAEAKFGEAADWTIVRAGEGDAVRYCVAERPFEGRTFRIGYDRPPGTTSDGGPKSGQWQFAIPHDADANWKGRFGTVADSRATSGTVSGSWTIAWLTRGDIARLEAGGTGMMRIDDRTYLFSAEGMSDVIAMVRKCTDRDR